MIPALTNLCLYARSVTATPTLPLYPDPNVRLLKYSLTEPPVSYVCGIVLVPTLTSKVLAEEIPVTGYT